MTKIKFTKRTLTKFSQRRIEWCFIILLAAIFLISPTLTSAYTSGFPGSSTSGCACHGPSDTSVQVNIDGLPSEYTPETTYSLTPSVDDGSSGLNGGFDLEVDKGILVNPGPESMLPDDKELHHSTSATATWTVDWTAPAAGSGQVSFTIAGIVINLDGSAGGDKWNLASFTIKEEGGVAQETKITMFTRFDAEQGERISVSGIISDVNGNPLSNLSVEFYRMTSYGQIKMGEDVSDSNGIVNISHRLSYSAINGSIVIEATFKGTNEYEASSNIEDIEVSTDVEDLIQSDFTVLIGFIFFIIGAVWVCIGYVVTLLLKIKKGSEN